MDNPHPFSSIYHQNEVDVSLLCEFTGNYTITFGGRPFFLFDLSDPPKYQVRTKHHQLGKSPRPMLLEMCKSDSEKNILALMGYMLVVDW